MSSIFDDDVCDTSAILLTIEFEDDDDDDDNNCSVEQFSISIVGGGCGNVVVKDWGRTWTDDDWVSK